MEKRKDVESMIDYISFAIEVAAPIDLVPSLHPWALGNSYVARIVAW